MRGAIAAIVLIAGSGAWASELKPFKPERLAFRSTVERLLKQGNYAMLEALAKDLAASDERYSSGISKLVDLYVGLTPERSTVGEASFEAKRQRCLAWVKARPDSYLPKIAMALIASTQATAARGVDWAHTVTPEQWAEHNKHIDTAWSWAQQALEAEPQDPEFYGQLITLCRLRGCPRAMAEQWLRRALELKPGYDAVYVHMANYLLPRWHGSREEFARLAAEASNTNEALGNIVYARMATVALLVEGAEPPKAMPELEWKRIRAGLLEIDRRHPNSVRTYHLLARFACCYGYRKTARGAFSKLSPKWDVDAEDIWYHEGTFRQLREWALSAAMPGQGQRREVVDASGQIHARLELKRGEPRLELQIDSGEVRNVAVTLIGARGRYQSVQSWMFPGVLALMPLWDFTPRPEVDETWSAVEVKLPGRPAVVLPLE